MLWGGLAGTGPLLVMLSQDLFGWGLPGEQSVAALLLPLAGVSGGTKPKSPLAGMGWGASHINQAGVGMRYALPDVCVGVAPEQGAGAEVATAGDPEPSGVAWVSLFTLR